MRVNVIGRYEQLPAASRDALDGLMAKTADCTGLVLNLAVNYSGRSELRDAVRALARDVHAGRLAPEPIDEDRVASYLYTAGDARSGHADPARRRIAAVELSCSIRPRTPNCS